MGLNSLIFPAETCGATAKFEKHTLDYNLLRIMMRILFKIVASFCFLLPANIAMRFKNKMYKLMTNIDSHENE